MKTFDPSKPVRTRDGRKARIIATDREDSVGRRLVALVQEGPSGESVRAYDWAGRSGAVDSPNDLVNVPERHVRWLNFWPSPELSGTVAGGSYLSREDADRGCGPGRLACVRIEFVDGEGLEP